MLQSMGSQKVSHDLATEQLIITCRLNTQVIKEKKKKNLLDFNHSWGQGNTVLSPHLSCIIRFSSEMTCHHSGIPKIFSEKQRHPLR